RSGQIWPPTPRWLEGLAVAALLCCFALGRCAPVGSWRAYAALPQLGLPGARYIRLDGPQADNYRALAEDLRAEWDTFVVIPGLNSLYFWSGKRPPTYFSITGERSLPNDRQQRQIVDALRQSARPLVLIKDRHLFSWRTTDQSQSGPLGEFVRQECEEVRR